MLDYVAWSRRVSQFVRRFATFPGKVEMYDHIEPPNPYDDEWLRSEECPLPEEVREFLRLVSSRCTIGYQWEPQGDFGKRLSKLFPGRKDIRGGGDLCELAGYSLTYRYESTAYLDPLGCLPIMPLKDVSAAVQPNGARIALDSLSTGARVVHVSGDNKHELSCSFDDFLMDWERIGFLPPDLEHLRPWLDPVTGRLDSNRGPTSEWMKILDDAEKTGWG